jgi:alkylation response protein AidB-like acyl-CoA dehydrogenase
MSDADLLQAAAALAPQIRSQADAIEAARRVPAPIVEELARAGLLRMAVPRAFGGGEASPETIVRVIETIARADASAGWCVMVHATTSLVSAYLDEDTAREVFGDPAAIACGVFAPSGKAVDAGDSYRVSGRWAFASGVEESGWRMVGAIVTDDAGAPVLSPGGEPMVRHLLLRAEETRVADTWNASGLRGTGSHDLHVAEALVPKRRSTSLLTDRPHQPGALYRFPVLGVLALGVAAVALGVAREAIVALSTLATEKRPLYSKRTLAQREMTQAHMAEAEALVRSSRALLFEAVGDARSAIDARGAFSDQERVLLRLSATHAARASARAVDLMYNAGGGSSVYASSPLQRHFRDVHVITQHVMVGEATYAVAGRVLLGLSSEVGML